MGPKDFFEIACRRFSPLFSRSTTKVPFEQNKISILMMNSLLSISLGAHNLAQARQKQLENVVISCPFCFRRLLSAHQETQSSPKLKEEVQNIIGAKLDSNLKVLNLLGFLRYIVGLEAIGAKVQNPMKRLKVLTY
jgi:heterodisulfide reductase subunit B